MVGICLPVYARYTTRGIYHPVHPRVHQHAGYTDRLVSTAAPRALRAVTEPWALF